MYLDRPDSRRLANLDPRKRTYTFRVLWRRRRHTQYYTARSHRKSVFSFHFSVICLISLFPIWFNGRSYLYNEWITVFLRKISRRCGFIFISFFFFESTCAYITTTRFTITYTCGKNERAEQRRVIRRSIRVACACAVLAFFLIFSAGLSAGPCTLSIRLSKTHVTAVRLLSTRTRIDQARRATRSSRHVANGPKTRAVVAWT